MDHIPENAEPISLAGFDAYGPFYRLPDKDGVHRFVFAASEKHKDGAGNIARAVLVGFVQGAMEAAAGAVISLASDFVANIATGMCVEAHVKVVRRTRSLVFLTADLTAGGQVLLTANGLAKLES